MISFSKTRNLKCIISISCFSMSILRFDMWISKDLLSLQTSMYLLCKSLYAFPSVYYVQFFNISSITTRKSFLFSACFVVAIFVIFYTIIGIHAQIVRGYRAIIWLIHITTSKIWLNNKWNKITNKITLIYTSIRSIIITLCRFQFLLLHEHC